MSMAFAFSVPGCAIVAAERRWARRDGGMIRVTHDGAPKLVRTANGFVAGIGDANPSQALLTALQDAGAPVSLEMLSQRAAASHQLFGGSFELVGVLYTTEGIRFLRCKASAGGIETEANPYGFLCVMPYNEAGEYDAVQALAVQAGKECADMQDASERIGRIAQLFLDVAGLTPLCGRYLDIGVLHGSRGFYLRGDAEALLTSAGQSAAYTVPEHQRIELCGQPVNTVTVGIVGKAVHHLLAYEILVKQPNSLSDPPTHAEDNQAGMQVITPDAEGRFQITYDTPPEGHRRYFLVRPYFVTSTGVWAWGPAKTGHIDPLTKVQPIVDSDDHEDVDTGYFFIAIQDMGLALTSITMGRQTGPTSIVQGLVPTRGPGEESVVKGRTLADGEYEAQVTLPYEWQAWLWFDLVFEGNRTMRVMSPALGPNRAPSFIGIVPIVIGTVIWPNAFNAKSLRVERVGGTLWQVDRDGTPSVDVAQQDDLGRAGLSSGSATYKVTIYSDPIAQRDGDTLTDAATIIAVVPGGGGAAYTLDVMTASAPPIGSDTASVTYKASDSTPSIATRVRYRVNNGAWTTWANVAEASPASAPIVSQAYNIAGLPVARDLAAQDPDNPQPQYPVNVEIEATLASGGTTHAVQVRSANYITNASDVA